MSSKVSPMKVGVEVNWDDGGFETDTGETIDCIDLKKCGFSVELNRLGKLYSVTTHTRAFARLFVLDNET